MLTLIECLPRFWLDPNPRGARAAAAASEELLLCLWCGNISACVLNIFTYHPFFSVLPLPAAGTGVPDLRGGRGAVPEAALGARLPPRPGRPPPRPRTIQAPATPALGRYFYHHITAAMINDDIAGCSVLL